MSTKKTAKPRLKKSQPKHNTPADLEGLKNMYNTLGTMRKATTGHFEMANHCECGDTMFSVNILLGSAQEAIGDVINRHHK